MAIFKYDTKFCLNIYEDIYKYIISDVKARQRHQIKKMRNRKLVLRYVCGESNVRNLVQSERIYCINREK